MSFLAKLNKTSNRAGGYEEGEDLSMQYGTNKRPGGSTRFLLDDEGESLSSQISQEIARAVGEIVESPAAARTRIAQLNHIRKVEIFCENARHILENGGKLDHNSRAVLLDIKADVATTPVYVQPRHSSPKQATASAPKIGLASFDSAIKDLLAQFPRMTIKWHGQFKREAVSGQFTWRHCEIRISMTSADGSREHFVARALKEAEAFFRAEKPRIEKEDREMLANSGEILARAEKAFE